MPRTAHSQIMGQPHSHAGSMAVAFLFGVLLTTVFYKSTDRDNRYSSLEMTNSAIDAFKRGKKEALATNPVSFELEETCLSVWANKQRP